MLIEFVIAFTGLSLVFFMGLGLAIAFENKSLLSEGLHIAVRDASTKPGMLVTSTIGTAVVYLDNDVFREDMTCIDVTGLSAAQIDAIFVGPYNSGNGLGAQRVPACHRVLRSAMVVETRNFGAGNRLLLRFPGVLLRNGTGLTIVRVPAVNGATTDLHRIITPPVQATLASTGMVSMDANYWHKYSVWLLGGTQTTLPAGYTAATVPAGYSAVDNGLGVYRAVRMQATAVSREEVQ